MAAEHDHSPLDHVVDHPTLEFPWGNCRRLPRIHLPGSFDFQVTRFMVMELVAAVLIAADHHPAGPARRQAPGHPRAGS